MSDYSIRIARNKLYKKVWSQSVSSLAKDTTYQDKVLIIGQRGRLESCFNDVYPTLKTYSLN